MRGKLFFDRNNTKSVLSTLIPHNINFKNIKIRLCVQYYLYLSPVDEEGGKLKELYFSRKYYIPPLKITLNKKKNVLYWEKNMEICVPVYYYIHCEGYGNEYKNFTREHFIKLNHHYLFCEVEFI